jgi:hypothetical protein
VGWQAGYSNTTASYLTAIGYKAALSNTTGSETTAIGYEALRQNTTGNYNSAVGVGALFANTTGSSNTAFGQNSLVSNTTASNNTAVGYQAGYAVTTGERNISVGAYALSAATTGIRNTVVGTYSYNNSAAASSYVTAVGHAAGNSATGDYNTFIGESAGGAMGSGAKNTILGRFSGNQGGLNITTASNYIVLSDGDGNPRGIFDGSGNFLVGTTSNPTGFTARINLAYAGSGYTWGVGPTNSTSAFYVATSTTTGVSMSTSATSWSSNSDERLKTALTPFENASAKVATLRSGTGRYLTDPETTSRSFLIAQDVQAVLPEAVEVDEDEEQTLRLRYTDLIPLLTAAIQEQQALITALTARLDAANL